MTTMLVSSTIARFPVLRHLAFLSPLRLTLNPMKTAMQSPLERFIVFEGGDGAGTTTQLKILGRSLERSGVPHWITSEPTDHSEGLLIRRILAGELARDPGTLARLYAADRNEHLRGKDGILQHLDRGDTVVCDRYVFSSLAYQGVACGPELAFELNSSFPLPELLIFFDIPPELSMERLSSSRSSLDIFEELPFQEKVRAAYKEAIGRYADSGMNITVVDASRPVEEVASAIRGAIREKLGIELDYGE
jgi:dTMP kinase